MRQLSEVRIAVLGLGYVGLPLAVAFGQRYAVTGFDIDQKRIRELEDGLDDTLEVSQDELRAATRLDFTSARDKLRQADTYIVTGPTPIDRYKRPDMSPLQSASRTIGEVIKPGDVVIYESTVYSGAASSTPCPRMPLPLVCDPGD